VPKIGSFSDYVERSKQRSIGALLSKACLASRIAKLSVGGQRERLYELKSRYLSTALRLGPQSFVVDSWIRLGEKSVLVGITSRQGFRFHVVIKANSEKREAARARSRGNTDLAA
jgi:hypothetical protein